MRNVLGRIVLINLVAARDGSVETAATPDSLIEEALNDESIRSEGIDLIESILKSENESDHVARLVRDWTRWPARRTNPRIDPVDPCVEIESLCDANRCVTISIESDSCGRIGFFVPRNRGIVRKDCRVKSRQSTDPRIGEFLFALDGRYVVVGGWYADTFGGGWNRIVGNIDDFEREDRFAKDRRIVGFVPPHWTENCPYHNDERLARLFSVNQNRHWWYPEWF